MSSPADPSRTYSILARTLLTSSIFLLVMGGLIQRRGALGVAPELLAWLACGAALLAPVVATLVRGQGLVAAPPADLQRGLIFFAVLEGAVVLCALALLVTRSPWPFFAAVLPIGVMAMNLPRRGR